MSKVAQFPTHGRGADSVGYRLLAKTPLASAYRAPTRGCKECDGRGWTQRERGQDLAVPSVVICDCMKES